MHFQERSHEFVINSKHSHNLEMTINLAVSMAIESCTTPLL